MVQNDNGDALVTWGMFAGQRVARIITTSRRDVLQTSSHHQETYMRMFLGAVMMLLAAFALGCDPQLDVTAQAPTKSTIFQLPIPLLGSFAALCGALVARNFYFVLVSIGIYCLLWAIAFGYTKSILPELTYWDMFLPNSPAVLGLTCAVGMGSLVGSGLSRAYSRYRKAA